MQARMTLYIWTSASTSRGLGWQGCITTPGLCGVRGQIKGFVFARQTLHQLSSISSPSSSENSDPWLGGACRHEAGQIDSQKLITAAILSLLWPWQNSTQSHLWGKGFLWFTRQWEAIIDGSQNRNSRQELEAEATEEHCSLAHSCRLIHSPEPSA